MSDALTPVELLAQRDEAINRAEELSKKQDASPEELLEVDRLLAQASVADKQAGFYREQNKEEQKIADHEKEVREDIQGRMKHNEAADIQYANTGEELRKAAIEQKPCKIDMSISDLNHWQTRMEQGWSAKEIVRERQSQLKAQQESQDILRTVGDATGEAGYTVPSITIGRYFDVLRNINGVRRAGVDIMVVPDAVPRTMPRIVDYTAPTSATGLITPEGTTFAATEPQFRRSILRPVKYTGLATFSREVIRDSATDIEAKVGEYLGRVIAYKSEWMLHFGGANTGEPEGLFRRDGNNPALTGNAGVQRISGTSSRNPRWKYADVQPVPYLVDDYPVAQDSTSFMFLKREYGDIIGTPVSTTDDRPIFRDDIMRNTRNERYLVGEPVDYSTFLPTHGAAHAIVGAYANWSALAVLAEVDTVSIEYDLSVNFKEDEIVYRAHHELDMRVNNANQIAYIQEATT